jgi:hypothetical protein
MAIIGDWSWWNIRDFGRGSGVCKWLMQGFADHKTRLVFKEHLMSQGYSEQEANEEWRSRYISGDRTLYN